ncbi:MAG: transposase, partial [Acetobacteraceae bacterium]|nr:transposase [Acetobacteraceae bacterium]
SLERTKTDAIDANGLARLGFEKRPAPTRLHDDVAESLRELVRHRDRLRQDFDDRIRQLHRLVDLGFPEFTRYVRTLDSMLATRLLAEYPTAHAFAPPTRAGSPSCATTGATSSATSSPSNWSTPPSVPSASTTDPPTFCRRATSARISTCGAAASPTSSATLRACSTPARSASCSRRSTASARNRPPASSPPSAIQHASAAPPPSPPMSAPSPASNSPASAPARGRLSHRSATLACASRCGCRCSAPCAEMPGCELLRTPARGRKATQTRPHRRHAQTAACHLQRRQEPNRVHNPNAAGAGGVVPKQRSRPRLRAA